MKKLFGLVFNRWTLALALLAALSLLVWIAGPLLAFAGREPLAGEGARWTAIGALAGCAVLIAAWRAWRARRGNAAVVQQLAAAPTPAEAAESPDLAAVRERFERAMLTLKRARFGAQGLVAGWRARLDGRYLYELPWYLIIGAPGSGKTTALHNCGLKFPLAAAMGDHAVRGVGGTRHCDWWFTDRAVLIDTAGRFTTQDSDRATDRGTWSGFLKLLAKARPRQPVNGVLVTVSLADLLTRGADERAQHAATVRLRLQELQQDLRQRFPVYLVVTKCDLLAGFMDYFATLDKEQRESPWGFTFPVDAAVEAGGDATALSRFDAEFDLLRQRLVDGLVERLQGERDLQRRARIYAFPSQFANLRAMLREFADAAFAPSPYEAGALLRGVYFISGTQEGTPIDRMLGAVARAWRLEQAVLAPNQSSGKSYFLSRLLTDVVFAESGLAGTNLKWERRRAQLALVGYAAVAATSIGAVAAWSLAYADNRRYLDDVAARVDAVRKLVQTTPNRNSPDLLPVVPALDATRLLAGAQTGQEPRHLLGWGLDQGRKLDSAARAAYDRMLVDAVLPRLALRVEEELRQGGDPTAESQYEALKTYLMLHDPERLDAQALKRHVERDWDARLARELTTEQRARLGAHLDALLAQGALVSPVPADEALVKAVRGQLAAVPLPQRVYQRMRDRGLGADYPEFTVARAAGNNGPLVFTRASGKPLTSGVPGLFSYAAYHKAFQNEVGRASSELADEQGWVLGIAEPSKGSTSAGRPLADEVRRLYLNDYAAAWEVFIADVRVVPLTSLAQSVQAARLLSAPDSPLPLLVKAMSRETTLGGNAANKTAVEKAVGGAKEAIMQGGKAIKGIIAPRQQQDAAAGQPIEGIVDDRFRELRRLATAPEGGKAPIDDAVVLIGEAYVLLNAAETAVKGGSTPPPSPVPNKMKSEAARLPEPVRSMLDTLATASAHTAQVMVRSNLGREVNAQVGEFCNQALAGRYPLDRRATREATPADFAQVFAPGGRIDRLFQDKLAPFVDTSARPSWRFRPVEGMPLGGDVGTLPQFQRAVAIRDTFFAAGATSPSLRLEFKPVEMDREISQFILDVDGQIVRYAHGPQIPTVVQWPGPRGSSQVRVQVSPPGGSGTSGMVTEGPWALFKLFDRVRVEPGNSAERFRATFDVDGRKAVFDITTGSVRNPFALRELAEFSCPSTL